MRCPWCGSGPVMIRGDQWECGWCGNFGRLQRSAEPQQAEITFSVSIVFRVDLSEAWSSLKTALRTLSPGKAAALYPLLSKVLLHEISAAIQNRNGPPASQKMRELETFLTGTPDLYLDAAADATARNIRSGILYPHEAELSEQFCGEFWQEVLSPLTPKQYYDGEPESLSDLLHELSSAYAYFSGADGEELGTAQERQNALNDAFYLHWQEKLLLHPDAARAKQLLARGEFPANEDICRDILVMAFPEEIAGYTLEDLEGYTWDRILEDVFERDVPKGIQMWRTLLDIAAPRLRSDPETAKRLLPDWDVLDDPLFHTTEAFLTALEDDTFARQVFQSACAGNLQRALLTACRKFNKAALGQRCLDMVLENPNLSEAWNRRLKQALTPEIRKPKPRNTSRGASLPPKDDLPDDGTVFHYCTVKLQGVHRAYSYLTGDLPLKVGDWVEVPFGKENLSRRGQVGSITACTRPVAPWPPEHTKAVLRIAEPPPVLEEPPPCSTRPIPVSRREPIFTSVPEPETASETIP